MTPSRSPLPLQEQLAQTGSPGIFRLATKDIIALKEAATELSLAFLSVDLTKSANIPSFIKALKHDLNFPDWFGGNLDALNDCLTDFSWHPAAGYVITLSGSERLRSNPTSFAMLNEVLANAVEEWQKRNIPFWVFYVMDDPAPAATQNLSSPHT